MTPLGHLIVTNLPPGFPANSMLFVRCFSVDLISPSKTPAGVCMLSVWIVWEFKNTFSAACSSWWSICEVFSSKGIEPKRNRHFKQQKITNLSQGWCPKSFQRLLFRCWASLTFFQRKHAKHQQPTARNPSSNDGKNNAKRLRSFSV